MPRRSNGTLDGPYPELDHWIDLTCTDECPEMPVDVAARILCGMVTNKDLAHAYGVIAKHH